MKPNHPYLVVEQPDIAASVEFLSADIGPRLKPINVSTTILVNNGKLSIKVKVIRDRESSSWEEHDFEVDLAKD